HTFSRAHDHSPHHLTLFHTTTRYGILHRHHDGVSDARVLPFRSAEHLDALDAPGPGVVGYVEIGFHLNHRNNPLGSGLKLRPSSRRTGPGLRRPVGNRPARV